VKSQTRYPGEILIIDGSLDDKTKDLLLEKNYHKLKYYKVQKEDSGLTRQRNFGISKISENSQLVGFLDDDTILHPDYFLEIFKSFGLHPEVLAVSGYITNEVEWRKVSQDDSPSKGDFIYDGWTRTEGSRFGLRRKFGLAPDTPPGIMPDFSHGYSTGFLPPSGKVYEVELLMGGISTYKTKIFKEVQFSRYFEGYGLYEDADFSLRISKMGKLLVNTNARVEHHHANEGRPNMFKYGKMVIRNGWYVWRIKNQNPTLKAIFKWHATSLLLTLVRLSNVVNKNERKKALSEGAGRIFGWISLWTNSPVPKIR
tara:strand:+ start:30658 stop:31596 length:939 start_codon:yes stop_codon:yes gene_type:complete